MKRFCGNCGNEINDKEYFCSNCGTPVNGSVTHKNTNSDKKNSQIKIVIITVVIMIALLVLGYFGYNYYDDLKWDKYWEEHNKVDNLAIIDCSLNDGEDKILSCSVKNKMSNFNFRYVNFRVEMSADIQYIDYKAYSNDWNISVDSSNNNSMFVSAHADYDSRQNDLTVGIEEYITLNFRVNDASKGSKIVFKYLNFEDNDSVSHRNENDIVINLIDYINSTSYEGYNFTSPDNKIIYSIVDNELNFKYEDYFGKLIKESHSYEELNSDETINNSIKVYQDNGVVVDKVQNYSCRNSEILSYKINSEDNVIIQYYFVNNNDKKIVFGGLIDNTTSTDLDEDKVIDIICDISSNMVKK